MLLGSTAVKAALCMLLPEPTVPYLYVKVALLEAHAHCAVLAAGSGDAATRRVVAKAQAPHASRLMDGWLG